MQNRWVLLSLFWLHLAYSQVAHASSSYSQLSLLRDHKVLLITGFSNLKMAELADFFRTRFFVPIPDRTMETFVDQMDLLEDLGIDYEFIQVNSLESSRYNENNILQAIQNSDKPVFIFTYSKGGLDLLEAMVRNPEATDKVAGWISFHAPVYGTPVAEWFLTQKFPRLVADLLLPMLNGSIQAVKDMSIANRTRYLRDMKDAIAARLEKLPVLFVGGYFEPTLFKRSVLSPIGTALKLAGFGKTDGFVPTTSMCLENYPCVVYPDMDHAAPVFDMPLLWHLGSGRRHLYLDRVMDEFVRQNRHLGALN